VAEEFLVPAAPAATQIESVKPTDRACVVVADPIGDAKKRAFLEAFADTGNVSAAARAADVGRRTHYDWLKKDKEYKAAYEAAVEDAADALELEARARAMGEQEPVFDKKGELVGHRKKASDLLMIFLLKGLRPDKYAQQHVLAGKGKGGAVLLEHIVAGVLTANEKLDEGVVDGELAS
jgi:transposase-like protein